MPLFYTEKGFITAAKKGDVETLQKYLATDKAAAMLKVQDEEGYTALHRAVERNRIDVVELLAGFGADINARTNGNRTALHLAAGLEKPDMLSWLLAKGLKPEAKLTNTKDSPLAIACYKNRIDNVQLLLDAGADVNDSKAVATAFRYGHNDICALLIERGIDLSATDDYYRNTPLHMAANGGNIHLLTLLLKQDSVDLDARNKSGSTALHLAAYNGHTLLVEALIEAGADLEVENTDGLAAADVALKNGKDQPAKIIQKKLREKLETTEKQTLYAIPTATDATGEDRETWLRLGDDKIAHIGVYPALERKLTEIFNFATQERLTISENLRTGAENTLPPQPFDSLPESAIDAAYSAFQQQGGTAERSPVLKKQLTAKTSPK